MLFIAVHHCKQSVLRGIIAISTESSFSSLQFLSSFASCNLCTSSLSTVKYKKKTQKFKKCTLSFSLEALCNCKIHPTRAGVGLIFSLGVLCLRSAHFSEKSIMIIALLCQWAPFLKACYSVSLIQHKLNISKVLWLSSTLSNLSTLV